MVVVLLLGLSGTSQARTFGFLDVETGMAISGYNDVRIPGDEGTSFSLQDDFGLEPTYYFRVRPGVTIADRHTISVLVAPLRFYGEGSLDKELRFEDTTFAAGTRLRAFYRFDSYRLTYRYAIYKSDRLEVGAGLTGKIRDAEISLWGPEQVRSDNTGFVPLINFKVDWWFAEKWGLLFRGDALAAPQGRAEDVLLAFKYRFTPDAWVRLGYRMLEGGADNDEVYTFALVHYGSLGLHVRFP